MNRPLHFVSGLGVGAGLMYFLDKDRGRRRRSMVLEQVRKMSHKAGTRTQMTVIDSFHRVKGSIANLRSLLRMNQAVPDSVLEARVRAKLGHTVSHPHAISVICSKGNITLSGDVLDKEIEPLMVVIPRVPGVFSVDNRLRVHSIEEKYPRLAGGKTARRETQRGFFKSIFSLIRIDTKGGQNVVRKNDETQERIGRSAA